MSDSQELRKSPSKPQLRYSTAYELRMLLELALIIVSLSLPLVVIINGFTTEWDDGAIPRVFYIPLALVQMGLAVGALRSKRL